MDKIDKMYAEYQQKRNGIQLLNFAVPTKKDIENLIVSIDTIVTQSGLRLDSMSAAEEKKIATAGPLGNVAIVMSLTGTYPGLLAFLSNLEQNTRLIDVISITVSPKAGGVLDIGLKANAYLVK